MPRAPVHRFPDQLPDATRGGTQGIELIGTQQRDPAGGGAFEYRRVTVEPPERRVDLFTERTGHGDGLAQ